MALDLVPLDRVAAEALLESVPAAADRDRCFAQSGGNPLLLLELARDGGRARRSRRHRRGGQQRRCPRSPATRGRWCKQRRSRATRSTSTSRLASPQLDEVAALAALDVLAERELVHAIADPRRFAFRHPIVRSAIYEALGAGERLAGHAAAASALAAMGRPLTDRAHHLAHAARPGTPRRLPRCVRRPRRSARRRRVSLRTGCLPHDAPSRRRSSRVVLAETLVEAGRLVAALDVVDEAGRAGVDPRLAVTGASIERHARAPRRGAAAAVARARRGCGRQSGGGAPARRSGRQRIPARRLRRDAALGAAGGRHAGRQRGAGRGGGAARGRRRFGRRSRCGGCRRRPCAGRAGETPDDDELGGAAEPAMAISWGLLALDRLPEGLSAARRIAAAARHAGNGVAAIPHDLAAVLALGLLGRITEAEPAADVAEQAARVSANQQLLQWALWLRAWVLMERGQIDAAFAAATESVALSSELDDSASGVVARAVLGAILAAREEPSRGRELLAAYDIDRGWICRWAPLLVEMRSRAGRRGGRRRARHASRRACPGDGNGRRAGGSRAVRRRSWRSRRATPRARPRWRWARWPRRLAPTLRWRSRAAGSSPGARCSPPIARPRSPS